jgi:histidine triad (HIT) family protein
MNISVPSLSARYNIGMAEDSIFTRIIKGEIPCHKIYEDELTFAFLGIHPVQPGHTLVIPKKQIEFVWDVPPADYQALMATVQKVALQLRDKLGVKFVGSQVIGVDVPHAHVHLIPFNTPEEYHVHPDLTADPDNAALAAMAERLKF